MSADREWTAVERQWFDILREFPAPTLPARRERSSHPLLNPLGARPVARAWTDAEWRLVR